MEYLVIPRTTQASASSDAEWIATKEVPLGGYFYDRLAIPDGATVGVRYWVERSIAFAQHPVFSRFLEDERFKFNQSDGYVDIVFNEEQVDALKNGMLNIETTQDFGGDSVVKLGDSFGILFSL